MPITVGESLLANDTPLMCGGCCQQITDIVDGDTGA